MLLVELIRFLRNSVAYLTYMPVRYIMPLSLRIFGYKQLIVGSCTIVVPAKQMKTILEGFAYLQTLDPEMFRQLTVNHRYLFWYHPKRLLQCRDIFTITDNFLFFGKEGVVIAFVQSILDYTIDYLNWEKTLNQPRETRDAIRREVQLRLFEWLSKRSFSPELVEHYRELADK